MDKTARYEVLVLAVPEITQDETKDLEKQLEKVVQKEKGSIISFERWGKYKLAYPVRKKEYGVYFLARFTIPKNQAILNEITNVLSVKFETIVMRSAISALDNTTSLEYQRPRSLEEAPIATEGTFKDRRHKSYEQSDMSDNIGDLETSEDFGLGIDEQA
ncbi:30S ribosomal protein S6 [Candidatus Dependentiae bacterium]|nr:MAG: 30S ribosomal protein S6 [Candidatus Dependentiae bacterium]